jgi:hypothetical protein
VAAVSSGAGSVAVATRAAVDRDAMPESEGAVSVSSGALVALEEVETVSASVDAVSVRDDVPSRRLSV